MHRPSAWTEGHVSPGLHVPPSPWESLPCTADADICIRGCGSASCFVSALIPQSCFRATLSPPAFWEAEAQNPMAEANFGPAGRDEARKNGGLHQDLTFSSFWRQKWKRNQARRTYQPVHSPTYPVSTGTTKSWGTQRGSLKPHCLLLSAHTWPHVPDSPLVRVGSCESQADTSVDGRDRHNTS